MKTTFKLGKMAMKAEVNEHGDLGGIAFEMTDVEQDVEIKGRNSELVKPLWQTLRKPGDNQGFTP